jgi:8-oxo-dGTP pyrophosphatase MutT (NUDIX family)
MPRLPLLTGERLAPSPVPLAAHGQSLPPAVCSGTEGGVSMTSTVDGAIRAAGGVVFRLGPGEPVIAVVHRPEHDDWVLPKGKLEAGESARDAALREVKEETGHAVTIGDFVGCIAYEAKGRPKLVEFWAMEARDDAAEGLAPDVDDVAWLPLSEAIERLTHPLERLLLENWAGAWGAAR